MIIITINNNKYGCFVALFCETFTLFSERSLTSFIASSHSPHDIIILEGTLFFIIGDNDELRLG